MIIPLIFCDLWTNHFVSLYLAIGWVLDVKAALGLAGGQCSVFHQLWWEASSQHVRPDLVLSATTSGALAASEAFVAHDELGCSVGDGVGTQ